MPIIAITSQPTVNKLLAAYRPVALIVEATATGGAPVPPVVYCDIYINGQFYKTISKTVYSEYLGASTRWVFDIQDAAQEYLGKVIGANGGNEAVDASKIIVKTFCRFRSSGKDMNGFTVPEGTVPVQGTLNTSPVPGTGTLSNTFYLLNSTLEQHHNQDLEAHLTTLKRRTWAADAYPLTRRPDRIVIGTDQSDYFPVVMVTSCANSIRLRHRYIGQTTYWPTTRDIIEDCDAVVSDLTAFPNEFDSTVVINWSATGSFIAFEYTIDGGSPIQTLEQGVTFTGLAAGEHTFTVKPLCGCGEGALQTVNFTI